MEENVDIFSQLASVLYDICILYLNFLISFLTGKYILAWKRGNAILTAGPTRVSPDERIRLVEGYNLEIRDVQTTDAGDYICHLATLHPKEITHTLEVLGNIFLSFISLVCINRVLLVFYVFCSYCKRNYF